MPNVFALNGRPTLPTFDRAEALISVTPDAADARAAALSQLGAVKAELASETLTLQAVEIRLQARPSVVAPQTLQELVRAARRRLGEERQKDARTWISLRKSAADTLTGVLER
ncbi:MAG TPA: hypothetical protein VEY30_00620 [Myxococcaceae bacterium]|nr:hypothetical protein [Myxococcaceae bacterium]